MAKEAKAAAQEAAKDTKEAAEKAAEAAQDAVNKSQGGDQEVARTPLERHASGMARCPCPL